MSKTVPPIRYRNTLGFHWISKPNKEPGIWDYAIAAWIPGDSMWNIEGVQFSPEDIYGYGWSWHAKCSIPAKEDF